MSTNLDHDGIPDKDIVVIVSCSALTKNTKCTTGTEYLKSKYPYLNIRSNFEFEGREAKVVIVIRNGGLLSFSLSNALSRAISRLILFMPDDHRILEKCCQKHLLVHQNKSVEMESFNMTMNESFVSHPLLTNHQNSKSLTSLDSGFSEETQLKDKT